MKADCQVLHPFQFLDCFHSVQFDQTTAVSLRIAVFMSIAYPALGVDVCFVPPCRRMRSDDVMTRIAGIVTYQCFATDAAADAIRAIPPSDVAAEHFVQRPNRLRHRAGIAAAAPT